MDSIVSSAMQFAAIRRARKQVQFLDVLCSNAGLDTQSFENVARLKVFFSMTGCRYMKKLWQHFEATSFPLVSGLAGIVVGSCACNS